MSRHYTISQLEKLVEQGSRDAPTHPQSGHMPSPLFREDVRRKIYNHLCQCERAVTSGEIARALGLKNSTWFRGRVDSLWHDGYLIKTGDTMTNGMPRYFYEVKR